MGVLTAGKEWPRHHSPKDCYELNVPVPLKFLSWNPQSHVMVQRVGENEVGRLEELGPQCSTLRMSALITEAEGCATFASSVAPPSIPVHEDSAAIASIGCSREEAPKSAAASVLDCKPPGP